MGGVWDERFWPLDERVNGFFIFPTGNVPSAQSECAKVLMAH